MGIHQVVKSVLCTLLLAATASAQFTITDVVNAASRQSTGIAQGALFAVSGKGIGPGDIEQASFPLPTTAGLDGVTIQVMVAGQTVDCIMVYVKPNEVGAILPSATPVGTGTVTVNNNGVTASKAINIVAAAFGIFTQNYGFGAGLAIAFNVNADGTTIPNNTTQSVMPGQDILINGTGLGAIPSDETQPGVTDVPGTTIQVYVGTQPATVVSAGRGTCCTGIDPAYLVPQGIAAWDVIQFTIPDGVVGCYVPVAVQIGSFVSNLASISVDPSGVCALPASILPPDLQQTLATQTGIATGSISLSRGISMSVSAAGAVNKTTRDTGSAAFVSYPGLPASMVTPQTIYSENVCTINGFPDASGANVMNGSPVTIVPQKSVPLDAGTPITVTGPAGTKSIVKRTAGMVFDYPSVTFGDGTPGNYYDAGHYTVTGPGGNDVGVFMGSTDVPGTPFVWTNIPDIRQPIDRTQDLTITWTGGIPGTQVTAVGGSDVGGVNAAILCAAAVEAGQMTIPSYVLLSLPATTGSSSAGQLTLGNTGVSLFTATGLDFGVIRSGLDYTLSAKYK